MSTSPDTFDPLAVVVDWLDACRLGELDALLDLYDERATLDCLCENVTLTGRKSIAAYWATETGKQARLCLHPRRTGPDRRLGAGRLPRLRRQTTPNLLSLR